MNKIYKIVWNAARGCYVVASEITKTHRGKKSLKTAAVTALAMGAASLGGLTAYADVAVTDSSKYGNTVKTSVIDGGKQYDISNQQVSTDGAKALNRFDRFSLNQADVANLHLEKVDHQINIVNNKVDIQGVVNALKNDKIGGDVYFFSNKGIAVGATGVFNVGRLTLGTNALAGEVIYRGYYTSAGGNPPSVFDRSGFFDESLAERAAHLKDSAYWGGGTAAKGAKISIDGTIHAADSILISTEKDVTIGSSARLETGAVFNAPSYSTAADYRNKLVNTAGIRRATQASVTDDGIMLSSGDMLTFAGKAESHGRRISVEGKDLTVNGGEVVSDGGKVVLSAVSHDSDWKAKPGADDDDLENGGLLIIKGAKVSSKSDDTSGDIEITAFRDTMGVSRLTMDGSTIDAGTTGDVTIHSTAATELYSWAVGEGAYAQLWMGKNAKVDGRNTIIGKNVEIAARATTTGKVGDATATEAEKGQDTISDDNGVWDLLDEFGLNARTLASGTEVSAAADVDIEKTDIDALGTGDKAGDIRILSDARSAIVTENIGLVNFGVNVGVGNVDSTVNVDNSRLYAKKDVDIQAIGDNKVSLDMIEFYLLDNKFLSVGLNFSWAELHSDVSAKVGTKAVISSEGNTSLSATSTRTLASTVANGGTGFALAGAVGISDTKAEAEMAGTVYAKGDVSVKAENKPSLSGDLYAADKVTAETLAGDTNYQKIIDWGTPKVMSALKWLKSKFANADKTGKTTSDLTEQTDSSSPASQSKPWNKLGLNAATSLLFSENDATASVTGKVRGLAGPAVDGKLTGSDTVGANSLAVSAETVARTSNIATAARRNATIEGETVKRQNSGSAAIAYSQQRNHSTAYVAGDVKTVGDVTVHAETKIPYQNVWKDGATSDKVIQGLKTVFGSTSTRFGLSELVDSWTQTQGVAENAAAAASVSVVNYDNTSTAYIGKKNEKQTDAPKVEAGGTVDVNSQTDITTVNFAGNVADFLGETSLNLLVSPNIKEYFNTDGWSMDRVAKAGLGGAALAVRQKNTTDAYIDDGAVVTAGQDVKVDGTTNAINVALSVAGGMAQSVAIDATVGVQRIDDETKARIGNAVVTAGENVEVSAHDDAKDVNLAGAVGVSGGSASIGASVAYNHIMRDTEAYISGKATVKADDNVTVKAKNSGEIIAASAAGAVTYDKKASSASNLAGSSGYHPEAVEAIGEVAAEGAVSGATGSGEGVETGESLETLVDGMAGEASQLSSSSDSAISQVADQDSSMADNTAQTKGGLAAAANVSVNRIHDDAKAHVGETDKTDRASITADALSVTSLNESAIKAVSGAVAASASSQKSTAIAGAFMYNAITNTNDAYVEKADLTLSGNTGTEDGKDIDESLTVSADNQASILNIAASGSGATRGNAVAGQVSLNWVDNVTNAHVKDSTVKADEAVTVSASDEGTIDSYTGAVAIAAGGKGTAVGASVAVNLIQGDTDANMEGSTVTGTGTASGGDVKVSAEETSHITAIVASAAAADGFGGAFSGTGNWISTDTNAHVDNQAMNVKGVKVDAGNHSSATLGVGNGAIGNDAAGASIAVMVNDSDVTAYAKSTDAKADSLTISADNAYNGSASDSESDSTAKTVAVGFAGGASKFAGSGSVTVNVISQTTDAYLGAGSYDIKNGDVTIDAKSTAKLFGLAGGASLSSGTGLGAAVDVQKYTGHTYGYVDDAVKLKTAGAVHVDATSSEKLTSIAATLAAGGKFAGAGAAGAHDISTDTKAYVGKEEGSSTTTVEAAKEMAVTAKDTTTLTTAAGSGGVSGKAGVGLSAAVEVVDKTVSAFIGDGVSVKAGVAADGKTDSLTVKATNVSESKTLANGLGAGGTVGVAGSASETFVTHTTDAHVGKAAEVTAAKGASIAADSDFTQIAEAAAAGVAGTAGVGLGNSTVSFTGNTKAYTDTGATIDGGTKVAVDASHTTHVTYATVAGGASGTAGVNGTVGVNVLKTDTKAYIAGGRVSAESAEGEGISVTAKDETTLKGGNGGLAIGAGGAGVGAAVGVTNIKKDTEAFVGGSAALETAGKTTVKAENTESLENITAQASGGLYAGLAGAVNVMNLNAITKAYTGDDVKMNQDKQKGGDITVEAAHTIDKMTSGVGGGAVGAGALGTAVDIGTVRTQTNAYLGNNNKIHTDGDLSVTAKDHMEGISSNAIAAAVGGFGLSGSISVYNFGSTQSDSDKALLTGKTSADSDQTTDMETWADGEINKSGTGQAFGAYDSGAMKGIKGKVGTRFQSETPEMGDKGTLAMVGGGTVIDAKGKVAVSADDKLEMENLMGNVSAGASAAGASVSVVHTDTLTQAKTGELSSITAGKDVAISAKADHSMTSHVVGASVSSGLSAQGTEETWNDKSNVKTTVNGAVKSTGGKVDISSEAIRKLDATLVGASVALFGAANGAVVTSSVTGGAETTVNGDVSAEKELTLDAKAETTLDASVTGASVGTYSGTGTGVDLSSDVTAKTVKGNGTLTGENISITAENTPKISAKANAAGLGLAGVGITKAIATSKDKAVVEIGSGTVAAKKDLTIAAKTLTPKDGYTVMAKTIAGAGGVLSGAVALSEVTVDQDTTVTVKDGATLTAKKADISAKHQDLSQTEMDSVSAGGVSGTGGETKATITSDAAVTLGKNISITTEDETAIHADNVTAKAWKGGSNDKTASSIGAALASGNGVVNTVNVTHNTKVDIAKATIKANASALTDAEIAAGKTLYDKNAIAIDAHSDITSRDRSALATGAAVGAAHVKSKNTANATTTVNVGEGSTLLAGDTTAAKAKDKSENYEGSTAQNYSGDYRGGSIAVGSRNDATMESTTLVDVYGAAGYAGSENNTTYIGKTDTRFAASAETAKGDISVMAGRDSSSTAGTIDVKAKSDILNATAIPISIKKDPVAKIDSQAALAVATAADIESDRDIHLKANAGTLSAAGSGEVKDWVNKVAEVFGSEGGTIGKKEISSSANVTMDGTAETGIHRKKSITIGGTDKDGTWTTTVKSDGDISYTYGGSTAVGAELSARLAALRQKLVDFGDDPAAKAAYEAEIEFLEEKMVAQGLGYYEISSDQKTRRFVELPPSTEAELDTAKAALKSAEDSSGKIDTTYQSNQTALDTQKTELGNLGTLVNAYKGYQDKATEANQNAEKALETMNTAKEAMEGTQKTLNRAAESAKQTLEQYIAANPNDSVVKLYGMQCQTYKNAESAYGTAADAASKAQQTADASKKAYVDAVTSYNSTYGDQISTTPADYNADEMTKRKDAIDAAKDAAANENDKIKANQTALKNQIQATEAFFSESVGGTEQNGQFIAKDKSSIVAVYIDGSAAKLDDQGNPIADGERQPYYLLHSQPYTKVTHNLQIDDITATLGDILFEGDNVSGSGTLHASGDASVTITNASPNNLKVGAVKVVGRLGTEGSGQGGTIYYNDVEMKGDRAKAIQEANQDKTKSVGFMVQTRDNTEDPAIVIENTFRPSDYTRAEGENGSQVNVPQYAASDTTLSGYIYNPRGLAKVSSKDGDVYTDGDMYVGSLEMKIDNGDFIQSYNSKSNSIYSVGGAPLNDSGQWNSKVGTGILANGNIFISARYVNINSTIQSGIDDWSVTIPETYKLYYEDGATKKYVTQASEVPQGRTVRVEGATGQGADKLSYDFANDRFVVDGMEVHGGKVSIVGTIINTTKDNTTAAIKALDGYGQIVIKNNSDKDIELRGLSTGEGTEGQIEITDLDRTSGKILRKTTYTRSGGAITRTEQKYSDGQPDKTEEKRYKAGDSVTYDPASNAYYTLQTGQDNSYTATYELHESKFDWWGIENKTPSSQELLARGATITDYKQGDIRTLNGGAIITGSDHLTGAKATTQSDGTTFSTMTYNTDTKTVQYTKKSKRVWYTLGLTKKYDYKLVEKKSDTKLNQYSVKADYGIGIGFLGNESGGTLTVDGGSGNVIVSGSLYNGTGATTLSGANIEQGRRGYIDTGTLSMTATTGSAGTKDAAIQTSASAVTGSAKEDFAVKVLNHGVTTGDIKAGGTVTLKADGDISQKADTLVDASRVNLDASGAITGANDSAFTIQTKTGEGVGYGLKAHADGNISIANQSGNLYLDSVISDNGNVALTTAGTFVDNNFTDLTDETAVAKLTSWAHAAVLEKSDETKAKQKAQLTAKVQSKYNEFQGLKAYVKDGVYTLDDATKASLTAQGIDVADYISTKQARYDALKDTVGTWTLEEVQSYIDTEIENSDADIFNNASVTKADIADDKYLTRDEKAEVLVGSAKSAQDLLVTFTSGAIKEGITDTNTNRKGTPHVSGKSVTLTTTGGDIGEKKEGMEIDLNTGNLESLTKEQLLALASAEKSDFEFLEGNKVKVSSVRPIDAETTSTLNAMASKGSIYLVTEGNLGSGSTLVAGEDLRIKGAGTIDGLTVGAGKDKELILESGEGAIKNTTITGDGVLTARAKDGVDIKKSDGDLIVNTIYASEGDVIIDLKGTNGNNSLLAEERDEEDADNFVNIEGENITITNVKDMKGEDDTTTLGLYAKGVTNEEGEETEGVLTANADGDAKISLFGNNLAEDTALEAENLTLTNKDLIGRGSYKAREALTVLNQGIIGGGTFEGKNTTLENDSQVKQTETGTPTFKADETLTVKNKATPQLLGREFNTIQGSLLTGKNVVVENRERAIMDGNTITAGEGGLTVTNQGTMKNGTYAGNTITVDNHQDLVDGAYKTAGGLIINNHTDGSIEGGTFTGGTLTLANESTVKDGTFTGEDELTVTNTDDASIEGGEYSSTEGSVTLSGGTIKDGTYTAKTYLTYNDGKSIDGAAFIAQTGNVSVTSGGEIHLAEAKAYEDLTVSGTGESELVIDNGEATTGQAQIRAAGKATVGDLTASTDAYIHAGSDVKVTSGTAGKDLTITSNEGSIEAETLTATTGQAALTAAKDVTITESLKSDQASTVKANGGDLTAKLIDAGEKAELYAGGAMHVTTLKAGTDATAISGGDMTITSGTAANHLTMESTEGNIKGATLEATGGQADITAAKDVTITESLKSAKDSLVKANGGDLTAKLIDAGEKADLYAGGQMNVTTLKAGSDATAISGGDMTITNGTAANNLTMESTGGSITAATLEATQGYADITADQSVTIGELTAGAYTMVRALSGALTADSITANENATLYSQGLMDIENLKAKNGTLVSGDSMDVTNAQIGDTLSMAAAKDIIVSQSDSVNKTLMNAGGSLRTKGANAHISSDVLEMTAGEDILVTDRSPVEKLSGVDTSEAAAATTGSGKAGSLLNAKAEPHTFDVSKKGTATLTARKGEANLSAKKAEIDTAVIGTEGTHDPATLIVTADNLGVDDLQSAADTLHVIIHGQDKKQAHYAGLHNTTAGAAIVKDSEVQHLNFTGKNDIGVTNSALGGDSALQTEKILVNLWKNPANTTAESIGRLFLHDYDIDSSEYFTALRNGLTINGLRFPYTADSVMNKSLFGEDYLGRDGKESEEDSILYAKGLTFGEVTEDEAYQAVK